MDFPENDTLKLAPEKAEAQARLRAAETPTRLCEDWRFGKPHRYATELVNLMKQADNSGCVRIQAPEGVAEVLSSEDADSMIMMPSIGSDKILALHLARFGEGVALFLEGEYKEPITITYETSGTYLPTTLIMAAPHAKARIIERHITHGSGTMVCLRNIRAAEGAELSLELHEEGSGASRAMNITSLTALNAKLRHLTQHEGHDWAREETIMEILNRPEGGSADVQLYSANRLSAHQVLDQHTRQLHTNGGASSNLLYKNVVDDHATAIFAGNIYVAPNAHNTDAYQANRNMLLSEKACVHSLPGLEILADKVRCSHGSASAPMDEEQLFYLLSRGIPRHQAQLLVAEGFLADVTDRMRDW